MNIFILDPNPRKSAEYHCDKHVVKMILETAQLLYTAHWMLNPEGLLEGAYKKTHVHHPCAIWVRESLSNYTWTAELGYWLCKEYTHRYGKTHKTEAHILWLLSHPPPSLLDNGITDIRMAMPDIYKKPNPIKAYQAFYRENKMKLRGIVKYTHRDYPDFL